MECLTLRTVESRVTLDLLWLVIQRETYVVLVLLYCFYLPIFNLQYFVSHK